MKDLIKKKKFSMVRCCDKKDCKLYKIEYDLFDDETGDHTPGIVGLLFADREFAAPIMYTKRSAEKLVQTLNEVMSMASQGGGN